MFLRSEEIKSAGAQQNVTEQYLSRPMEQPYVWMLWVRGGGCDFFSGQRQKRREQQKKAPTRLDWTSHPAPSATAKGVTKNASSALHI
jgi:hypothetical protein